MASTSNVKITIALQEPDLDDDELQDETQKLLKQMLERDEVEDASLFSAAEAPAGSKSVTGLAVGWLWQETESQSQQSARVRSSNLSSPEIRNRIEYFKWLK